MSTNTVSGRELTHDLVAFDSLSEGVPVVATVGRREFILVRWRERVYALRNVCPHQLEPFQLGDVRGLIDGGNELGELISEQDDPVITCPRHGWQFKLGNGQCTGDPTLRVRSYPVEVKDGRVLVNLARSAQDRQSP